MKFEISESEGHLHVVTNVTLFIICSDEGVAQMEPSFTGFYSI